MRPTFLRYVLWTLVALLVVEFIYGSALTVHGTSHFGDAFIGWGLALTFILIMAAGGCVFALEYTRQQYEHELRKEEQKNIMKG